MEIARAKENAQQDIGLMLLGIGTAFGIWSATNTSPTGTVGFGCDNEPVARQGMLVGIILVEAIAGGIWLVYGTKNGKSGRIAAVATGATGAALWIWYDWLLNNCEELRKAAS